MMKSSIYKALEKMNELEKEQDRLEEKADEKEERGKVKSAEYCRKQAREIRAEIEGMECCLLILGLGAWRQCDRDTNYIGIWHIPLDDIEKVC